VQGSAVMCHALVKRFGAVLALDGVDLLLPYGAVLAVLGPNGAGKTTAVRVLTTLVRHDSGRAEVCGVDVARRPAAVRGLIGLSGQHAAVDGYLTARENLRMIGRLSGLSRVAARRRAEQLAEAFDLTGAGDRTARTYSGGMRRRLDVAASLVADPPVLFLDEPTTGLDPRGRAALWQLLADLTAAGTSILLTTQYLEEADRLAHTVTVLDRGAVIATGTPDELKSRVGGDRLELRAAPGTDPAHLVDAMAGLGSEPPRWEADRIVIPVADGPGILPQVAARLAAQNVRVADLAVRRPTLDDVFLALTGQTPAADPGNALLSSGGPR
jgi:ABC-2 type transport system ATP-binding protein